MPTRPNADTDHPNRRSSNPDPAWLDRLHARLETQRADGLFRTLPTPDAGLVDLGSNDYLGLRRDPRLAEAVADAARTQGVGAGASRILASDTGPHSRLERRLAGFKHADAAILLPTGYTANLAAVTALSSHGDLILLDRLNHASLLDAAMLANARQPRVAFRRYQHHDADHARSIADQHIARSPGSTVWIVTDSVFSMDGDIAPIPELARLRDDINSARDGACALILDEAHATGVLGATGAGADELFDQVADITISTASKALGSLGGFIAGPLAVIESVINFARSFIYTTAAPAPQVAAIDAALDVLESEPQRRDRLHGLARSLRAALISKGWTAETLGDDPTPIIPLIVGDPAEALRLSQRLADAGFRAPAIRPPSVPVGASRVRISLTAAITDEDLARLIAAIPRTPSQK